jgi:hypothetical protein
VGEIFGGKSAEDAIKAKGGGAERERRVENGERLARTRAFLVFKT